MNTVMNMKTSARWCCALLGMVLIASTVRASDRPLMLEQYCTLAYAGDSVTLAANETAVIVAALPISPEYNSQTIDYKRGTNSFVTIALPLGGSFNPMPLVGPGVVRISDPVPVGVVGLKIVKRSASIRPSS
jgi:hypothetical protein